MINFRIKQGLSTDLFSAPGVINSRLLIDIGCWYLCTDTACLYLGVAGNDGKPTLKRINRAELADPDVDVAAALQSLANRLAELEEQKLFKKIDSESDLPDNFDDELFDENLTYYRIISAGHIETYIYDKESRSYYSTNNMNELVIRTLVTEAIDEILDERFNLRFEAILPDAVKSVLTQTILYGGDANPYDD